MMNKKIVPIFFIALSGILTSFVLVPHVQALIPANQQYVRYIYSDGSFAYFYPSNETYVRNTLPNEWIASWTANALQAGAVIIRSGAYWRTNRSILQPPYPNKNCYYGAAGGYPWYVKSPIAFGGHENYFPGSAQSSTNSATNATNQYHAEIVNQSNRPDKLLSFQYNSTIQNRTNSTSGTWTDRIKYAYTGSGHPGYPYNPNKDCNQQDSISITDPTYPNY